MMQHPEPENRLRLLGWSLTACVSLLLCPPPTASAQGRSVVAIMSEASAPEFAAAAPLLRRSAPNLRLRFRSTAQVSRMTDAALRALVAQADVLLLTAVYGDEAQRLQRVLADQQPPSVVPIHGDARLLTLARVDGRAAFPGLSAQDAAARLRARAARRPPAGQPSADASAAELLTQARRYREGRGARNIANLVRWLAAAPADRAALPPPRVGQAVRFLRGGAPVDLAVQPPSPTVVLLDYDYGDQAGDAELHGALCEALKAQELACLSALARWGAGTIEALQALQAATRDQGLSIAALVTLQDFVLGGGAGAQAAREALERLNVPVLKALRLRDRTLAQWRASEDGLPDDSVHYRLAMPEVQGVSQPFVVAAAGPREVQPESGLELSPLRPARAEIDALARRAARWWALRAKPNADKRVALVYYNHPPGRHNIGADNLDVPASLLSILRRLKAAGYQTGPLPPDREALLVLLQERGVNLPEDRAALARMAPRVAKVTAQAYTNYLQSLPPETRAALSDGPLGALLAAAQSAAEAVGDDGGAFAARVERELSDVRHLVEGATHPLRARALALLDTLRTQYARWQAGEGVGLDALEATTDALRRTGIEGLRGWGEPPGRVMVHGGTLLVPGVRFGNVFVGPQPPRGWELNEELLHANLAFPPPHQYLAFYRYLRSDFGADAVVHVGRHSTYEFLPGKRTGLMSSDFSRLVLDDLPSVYLYIVDGVGEGIQAKRRGHAVIVDHLTPSLRTTPLYDELLSLRQLVESYESSAGTQPLTAARALRELRATIQRLHLREELESSMRAELDVRGITFDEADGELLVHEVGHYLTKLQERFMPHGLHVFGQPWSEQAVQRMLTSMGAGTARPSARQARALRGSPEREARALLAALDGRFVAPGPGNDPVRTPGVLPTGRNFHALDASVLPTRLAHKLGAELAREARREAPGAPEGAEAVVLWASDTVRDEGAMVAFGLDMLGLVPRWNSRGIVQSLERQPLTEGRVRRDTTFIVSGLFRDLYGQLIDWLDQGVLTALEGSARTIARAHPRLIPALRAALAPLRGAHTPGEEPLAQNQLAAHWVARVRELLDDGVPAARAGPEAAARVFGDAPGSYGAGVNRLAERSGAWHARDELARTYVRRMGHAYGGGRAGTPLHDALAGQLARTEHSYLGRASNLYGVLDNNDVFDYLGGLGLAVEKARGAPPRARVVQHADPKHARLDALPQALLSELRGRHLNPTYLKGLMAHGYAGARTMGSGFMENLWGWQVTSPHIVKSWVWDEVKAVYLDDKHGIGLADFLAEGQNVHVRTNMQAILLVAAHKGFWEADQETLAALSTAFAQAVVTHGLPGSGHTRPDHPVFADVKARVSPTLAASLSEVLDAALGERAALAVSELTPQTDAPPNASPGRGGGPEWWLSGAAAALLIGLGFAYERRRSRL